MAFSPDNPEFPTDLICHCDTELDEAAFLTGCALDVDGGAHLGYMPGVVTK